MRNWQEYWWTSITGPNAFSEAVIDALHHKNVCLIVPNDLPWRQEMRDVIRDEVRRSSLIHELDIQIIDVNDECSKISFADDIGSFLLSRYASSDKVRHGRRPHHSFQDYFRAHNVLANRIIWLKGFNREQEGYWLSFCRNFAPGQLCEGRFILECRWEDHLKEDDNLAVVSYEKMVDRIDLSSFNSIFIKNRRPKYSALWQEYISTLCSFLCGADVEVSHYVIDNCDLTSQEPLDCITTIVDARRFPRRGEINDQHILNIASDPDRRDDFQILIWKAQLQTLFPLLEFERRDFIKKYYRQLEKALTSEYYDQFDHRRRQYIEQFNERITDPYDLEIGTIARMLKWKLIPNSPEDIQNIPPTKSEGLQGIHTGKPDDLPTMLSGAAKDQLDILSRDFDNLLTVPESSNNRVKLLHNLRNSLAHCEVCRVEDVAKLINNRPFKWS